MSTDLEPRLCDLFTAQATAVTSEHVAAVIERDYQPRRHRRPVPLITIGLVSGAAAAAVAGALATSGVSSRSPSADPPVLHASDSTPSGVKSGHAAAVSNTIALAGYTITLPASFDARVGTCTIPLPDGSTRPGKPGADGACAAAWESSQPPSWMPQSVGVSGPHGPLSSGGPHTPMAELVAVWSDRAGAQLTATVKIFFGDSSIKYAIVSIGMPHTKTVTGEQLDAAIQQAVAQSH